MMDCSRLNRDDDDDHHHRDSVENSDDDHHHRDSVENSDDHHHPRDSVENSHQKWKLRQRQNLVKYMCLYVQCAVISSSETETECRVQKGE